MPDMSQFAGGDTLNADEIKAKGEIPCTIQTVEQRPFPSGPEWILTFVGSQKIVTLNKGMIGTLCNAFGNQSEGWEGKKIVLTTYQGRRPDGTVGPCKTLRAEQPEPAATTTTQPDPFA